MANYKNFDREFNRTPIDYLTDMTNSLEKKMGLRISTDWLLDALQQHMYERFRKYAALRLGSLSTSSLLKLEKFLIENKGKHLGSGEVSLSGTSYTLKRTFESKNEKSNEQWGVARERNNSIE
jgi:hypothetical protein